MDDDLTGMRYGRLTVLKRIDKKKKWICKCDCGAEIEVYGRELTSGRRKSCGCQRTRARSEDISGVHSGKLIALERTEVTRRGAFLWRCRCDCGKEILTEAYKIRNQQIVSCGCVRSERRMVDIASKKYGRITALERLAAKRGSSYLWRCQCDCGKEVITTANALISGNTRSCGCRRSEAMKETLHKHGTIADHVRFVEHTNVDRLERKKLQKNNTSGHTGVQARGSKWIAVITFQKKVCYLGIYKELDEAVKARQEAEKRLFGDFLEWYYKENKTAQPGMS